MKNEVEQKNEDFFLAESMDEKAISDDKGGHVRRLNRKRAALLALCAILIIVLAVVFALMLSHREKENKGTDNGAQTTTASATLATTAATTVTTAQTTTTTTSQTTTTTTTTTTTAATTTTAKPVVTTSQGGGAQASAEPFDPTFLYLSDQVIADAETNYKIQGGIVVTNIGTPFVRALEQFGGSKAKAESYAAVLNKYKEALGDSVNVYNMVIPTSAAFYTPAAVGARSQSANIADVAAALSGVVNVDAYSILNEHKLEYLYSRTDYHWQPLGAYYAAKAFAEAAGLPYADISTYTQYVRSGYLGAFYTVNKVNQLAEYPELFAYYKPDNLAQTTTKYYDTGFSSGREGSLFFDNNKTGSSYTVFVGTDQTICEFTANAGTGRTLVIFKDSYGNALLPFLSHSFDKVYLCDFRYFDINAIDFIKQVGATDLLFAMSPMATNSSTKVGYIDSLLTK